MTTKLLLSKTISSVLITGLLIALLSCNTNDKQSAKASEVANDTKTEVTIPSTDLPTAVFFGNLEAVKQHIAAGTDLNVKDEYGSTPLHVASTFGRTDIAIALINGDADLTVKNNEGSTALHIAAFFCRTEIVAALLEKGVDKSITNNYGSTALQSVQGPFENVKPIYDEMAKNLGPFGLKLDYNQIEETRPVIGSMLK